MLSAAVLALALSAPPVLQPTHAVSIHPNGFTSFAVKGAVHGWSSAGQNVFRVSRVSSTKKATRFWIDATSPGRAAFVVTCDANHQELWLVEVR